MEPVTVAEAYYQAMNEKNFSKLEKFLHPEIHFLTPLGEVKGKEPFLQSIKNFCKEIHGVTVRAAFGGKDQAMIAYNAHFPDPIGTFPAAALMTVKEGLITRLELFYDGRPVEKKQKAVFN